MARKTIQKTNKAKRGGNKTRKQRQRGSSSKASKIISAPPGVKDIKSYAVGYEDGRKFIMKELCKMNSNKAGEKRCQKMFENLPSISVSKK